MQAGPYGITQVDVAGIYGAYQQMQENRIRSMILQKQMENKERKAKTQDGIRAAIGRYTGGGISEAGAVKPADVPAEGQALLKYASPQALTGQRPQPAQAQPMGDRRQLFAELLALDIDSATNVMEAFSKMDKAELDRQSQAHTRLMQIAAGILQLPPAQRKAALQQSAGELQQLGFTPERLSSFDPSDQNLRQIIVQGMDVERIAKFVQPDYMNVNGEVIDQNALARGEDPVRYRSEFIDTTQGLARRPGAGAVAQPRQISNAQEYEALPPGTEYIDPNGVRRTKGGASPSNGSPGFP